MKSKFKECCHNGEFFIYFWCEDGDISLSIDGKEKVATFSESGDT
jgi:hypothetical protein